MTVGQKLAFKYKYYYINIVADFLTSFPKVQLEANEQGKIHVWEGEVTEMLDDLV